MFMTGMNCLCLDLSIDLSSSLSQIKCNNMCARMSGYPGLQKKRKKRVITCSV